MTQTIQSGKDEWLLWNLELSCAVNFFFMIDAEVDLDYVSDILPHWMNKLDHQEMNHAS